MNADRTGRTASDWAEEERPAVSLGALFLWMTAGWLVGYLLATLASPLLGNRMFPWIVARAAGMTAYLLLELAVMVGVWLSHPWRLGRRRPSPDFLYRTHTVLSVAALVLVAAHATALALDPYVQVGWKGAVIPGASGYRAGPVAAGVLAAYLALVAALSAGLGPRMARRWSPQVARRLWLPLHRLSAVAWAAAWFHGVLAGSDTPAFRLFYAASGAALLLLAATRYLASPPAPAAAASSRQSASWSSGGTVLRADGLGRQATGRRPQEQSN